MLKIGWNCPFTFPVLASQKDVELCRIVWEGFGNGIIGGTDLCRKLTAIFEYLKTEDYDGLVVSNCCNLSDRLYSFFAEEFGVSIFEMELPRKENMMTGVFLDREWDRLKVWLESIRQYRFRDGRTSGSPNRLVKYSTCNQASIKNGFWCRLPEEVERGFEALTMEDMGNILLEEVHCCRMLDEEGRTLEALRENGTDQIDDKCVMQCYLKVVLAWTCDRK